MEVELAGLPVIAASAASRPLEQPLPADAGGLLAVALVLWRSTGRSPRALVPLVPIVLATGWSALVLWLTRIPLNPMSAALGALTIAIATEFSVILAARFRQERRAGRELGEALRGAYARTGAAVLASGVTAIAGFAVLVASDVRMLRDFGLVTVIDLAVALLGVMLVLPAALVWAERRGEGALLDRRRPAVPRDRRGRLRSTAFGRRRAARSGSTAAGALAAAGVRRPRPRPATGRRRERRPGRLRESEAALSRGRPPHSRLPGPHRRARSASATSSTGRW